MKPSQVAGALTHLVKRRRPVFLWGAPGVGKSDTVAHVAKNLELELRDVRLSLMDPTEIKGFPVITDVTNGTGRTKTVTKGMSFVPPALFPTDPKSQGILFLDEMNSAPQAVQAAAYQLILNRRIGEYTLPDGWAMIAAGNQLGQRAVVNAMPSPLANRFVHIDFDVDMEDWYAWATVNGISDITRAFIRFRPGLLHSFDPSKNERAFPTPRSWAFVDDVLKSSLDSATEYDLIKGTVGEGAAAEYLAFTKSLQGLPTPEEVLLNPDTAPIPTNPSARYAACTMLDKKATKNNFGRLLQYVERMTPEYQVLFVRSAAMANRDVTQTKEYTAWVLKNKAIVC